MRKLRHREFHSVVQHLTKGWVLGSCSVHVHQVWGSGGRVQGGHGAKARRRVAGLVL